nr:hypothetical protein [uncultured Rhodopila sp.]
MAQVTATTSDQNTGTERVDAPVPHAPAEMGFRYHFYDFLTESLIDLSQVFNGDLHQMLILAVLGRMHIGARISGAWEPPAPPPSMSASRLSDLTAIPRQTVRRKLLDMKAKGWLVQDDRQEWRLAMQDRMSNAHRFLADIDARGIDRAIRLARLFHGAG